MNIFWGITRYEFLMQIRRRALWIALAAPYVLNILMTLNFGRSTIDSQPVGWSLLFFTLPIQLFAPIVAGFFLSDRLYRDQRLGTDEWITVNGATPNRYIWGKYLGVVSATLLVTFIYWILALLIEFMLGIFPADMVGWVILAFFLMAIPTYFFIGAYCIAVPSVMPLRLFQILFTCYWLWSQQQGIPSVFGTPLTPTGDFAVQTIIKGLGFDGGDGFLHGPFGWTFEISPAMTAVNIGLLFLLALIALVILEKYLVWKQERS
jgi:ABC-type transport system involved in multi-copper enzyme maturation permease subunit